MSNERLLKFSEYNIGVNIYDGTVIISVQYPEKWKVVPFENDKIENVVKDGICYYGIPVNEDVDEVFDIIDTTIKFNKDLEKKAELFNKKIGELKELFVAETLEDLETLEFKIKRKKIRNAKNQPKKVDNVNDKEETENKAAEETVEPAPTATVENEYVGQEESGESIDSKIEAALKQSEGKA